MARLLVIASITSSLLLLQYVGSMMRASVALLISAGLIGGGIAASSNRRTFWRPSANNSAETLARRSLIVLIGFAAYKSAFDAVDYLPVDHVVGIITLLRDCSHLGIAALIIFSFGKAESADKIAAFGLGVAGYAAVNWLAFRQGIVHEQLGSQTYVSLSSAVSGRYVAPFGPGLNSYGNMVTCGALFCLFGIRDFWVSKQRLKAAAALVGMMICLFSAYMVEIRAGLILIAFGIGWMAIGSSAMKRPIVIATAAGVALLPLVASLSQFEGFVELVTPRVVLEGFQRTTQDIGALGGRTDVWRYGLELLMTGKTGWFGQGVILRDSSPVVDTASVEGYGSVTLSFHNGVIELLVVYGPIFGLLGVLALVATCWLTVRHMRRDGPEGPTYDATQSNRDSAIALVCCLMIANYLEAFVATSFFWAALILTYSLFINQVQREETRPSPNSKTGF